MRIWNLGLSTIILALGLGCLRYGLTLEIGSSDLSLGGIHAFALPFAVFLIVSSILPLNTTRQEIAGWIEDYRNRLNRSAKRIGDKEEVTQPGRAFDRLFD